MKSIAAYFELQDPNNTRWLSMEGFRGFAVLLIFFVHYSSLIRPLFAQPDSGLHWMTALHEVGNAGVDLFFVLSGFLIYRSVIRKPINTAAYTRRRIVRIYPTFLVILGLYLALSFSVPSQSKLPGNSLEALKYVFQNALLLPGIFDITPIVHVAWSLSYEVFFYIIAPILTALLGLRSWHSNSRLGLFLVLIVGISLLEFFGLSWHYRLTMFLGGMVLYEISPKQDTAPAAKGRFRYDMLALFLLGVALATFTLLGRSRFMLDGTLLATLPSFTKFIVLNICLVFILYRSLFMDGWVSKLFSFTPLRWLGNMSYSYYLAHSLGLHVFFKALAVVWPSFAATELSYIVLAPVAFAATLGVSAALYLSCERPLSLT